ncbi:MAG: Na/Pi cotransporter family protein [Clostridia bacterium]|nr:Na/Pi cotransporter family protein [Clostridia bacterium]
MQHLFEFLSGLGLFLLGMNMMSEGLELAAGSTLKKLVSVLTTKKILGVLVGIVVTGVIQSSSATTVMVVGFVNAGIMTLAQSVGVIMGANIGTTVTSVLVAFNPEFIGPFAIFFGVVLVAFFKKKMLNHMGGVLAGFGILLLGLDLMSSGMNPLRDFKPFTDMLVEFSENPILGLLAGIIFTAVIQSSSASIGILQGLAMAGAIVDVRAALFVLFGQNIGTCVTALLSSVGTSKTAKRTAVVHLLFNVLGALIFTVICMVLPVGDWLRAATPNVAWQIAIAHIVFNVVSTLLLMPFSNLIVKLACLIVRGKEGSEDELKLLYVDERILKTPPIAVAQIIRETERMAEMAKKNITLAVSMFEKVDDNVVEDIYKREKYINYLNHEITLYLVKINALDLAESDSKMIGSLFHVVNDLERIGDHAENLLEAALQNKNNTVAISKAAIDELNIMFNDVITVFTLAMDQFDKGKYDANVVQEINRIEANVDKMADEFQINHVERLNQLKCSPESGMVFAKAVSNLERVSDHATNIADALDF